MLEKALPGALTAHGELPAKALLAGGTASVPVSYATAPTQVPGACPSGEQINKYVPNTSCSAAMSWTGTVSFQPDCGAQSQSVDCIKKKVKADATRAVAEYTQRAKDDGFNSKVNCSGALGTLTKKEPGGKAFCAALTARKIYDLAQKYHYRQIANDPPDAGYAQVAKPRSPVKQLGALRRLAPATGQLMKRYLRVAGLSGAVMTAQNRASAAYLALSGGDQNAAAPLASRTGPSSPTRAPERASCGASIASRSGPAPSCGGSRPGAAAARGGSPRASAASPRASPRSRRFAPTSSPRRR